MVTPLDYYLHNSTFITHPREMGHMYKTKRESLPSGGGFLYGFGSFREFFGGYLTMDCSILVKHILKRVLIRKLMLVIKKVVRKSIGSIHYIGTLLLFTKFSVACFDFHRFFFHNFMGKWIPFY